MIDEMPVAGPELDRLVHEKVLKGEGQIAPYSTDITEAWELWRRLPRPKRLHVDDQGVHHCMCGGGDSGADGGFQPATWEKADKMPRVICLAALKQAESR